MFEITIQKYYVHASVHVMPSAILWDTIIFFNLCALQICFLIDRYEWEYQPNIYEHY